MSFNVTSAHVCISIFILFTPLRWGVPSWLGCGYCWPRGCFHPTGLGLLANRRVVLGTWPLLPTNVVNFEKRYWGERSVKENICIRQIPKNPVKRTKANRGELLMAWLAPTNGLSPSTQKLWILHIRINADHALTELIHVLLNYN